MLGRLLSGSAAYRQSDKGRSRPREWASSDHTRYWHAIRVVGGQVPSKALNIVIFSMIDFLLLVDSERCFSGVGDLTGGY